MFNFLCHTMYMWYTYNHVKTACEIFIQIKVWDKIKVLKTVLGCLIEKRNDVYLTIRVRNCIRNAYSMQKHANKNS